MVKPDYVKATKYNRQLHEFDNINPKQHLLSGTHSRSVSRSIAK